MLASIIASLNVAATAISANGDPARFAQFELPVLPDGEFVGQGPLAGVLAGLHWAHSLGLTALLTVPGDTPCLPLDLVERLAPAPASAASGGRYHHLVALWPLSCQNDLRTFLSRPGPRHVVRFAERIGMRYVDFPVLLGDPFMNINTPEELTQLRRTTTRAAADDIISDVPSTDDPLSADSAASIVHE